MEHDKSEVEILRAEVAALREETKRQQAVISLVNRKLDHCGITRAEIIRERDTARALLLRVGKWVPDTTDEFVDLRAFLRGDEARGAPTLEGHEEGCTVLTGPCTCNVLLVRDEARWEPSDNVFTHDEARDEEKP